jgi:hypothetical protein
VNSISAQAGIASAFTEAQGAVSGIGNFASGALADAVQVFGRDRSGQLDALRAQAGALAADLTPARQPAESGLENIAQAYERWLVRGGLETVMSLITDHFDATPTSGAAAESSVVGRAVTSARERAGEPPSVTVQIDELVIEVEPPEAEEPGETPQLYHIIDDYFDEDEHIENIMGRMRTLQRDRQERGDTFVDEDE